MSETLPDIEALRYQEEIQMGQARWGSVAVVSGEVLLWMDLILLSFVYSSIRDGSWFWVWWVLSQGTLGAVVLIAGKLYRYYHVS
ncbi:MAG TPA: hypothetical protein VL983_10750 [Terriglobales bacterium]|nr:hypothetical protein [Terriglobales bacterium]